MAREVIRCLLLGVGNAGRQQSVRDRLGIHVGEAVGIQVVDERFLKGRHQRRQRPALGLDSERGLGSVTDAPRECGQADGELLRRCNDLAVTESECGAPAFAPPLDVAILTGPREVMS